jgi:glycerol-3-phosphate O-acyltransferase / dihydroxyacetone phosphate acyltransferase
MRQMVRGLVRIYYPRIEVTGREAIPRDQPVLFVANHPNALMDPVIVGIAARRPVHFLAKAPLFEVPVFGKLMHALGMLPAYRAVDDAKQVGRNVESLAKAAKCLAVREAVGIFPEGKSHDLFKVDQVKTGAARIAVQAVAEGASGLVIVPLGLNYEQKDRLFTSVWVRVGEPLEAAGWLKQHEDDERKVVRALTAEIDQRLRQVVIHLNESKWEPFLHDLEVLRPPPKTHADQPAAPLRQRKRIADAMNYFLETDRPSAEALAARIERHHENLTTIGMSIRSPMLRMRGAFLVARMKGEILLLLIGLVPALAGTVHHLMPFLMTRAVARLFQTPGRSSVALARLLTGLPLYAAWYALAGWWLSQHWPLWGVISWLAAMPVCGIIALHYWPRARGGFRHWLQQAHMWLRPEQLRLLREEQLQIRHELRGLAERYAEIQPRQ